MKPRIVRAIAAVTFREFWRSPDAVFWTYGFPLLMALVLGYAFQTPSPQPLPVAVVASAEAEAIVARLQRDPRLRPEVLAADAADRSLARGRTALLVRPTAQGPVLRSDPTRPDAELARLLVERALRPAGAESQPALVGEVEDRPGSRYIDFLIPGLIGLNLLGAGMWGIGFNLVHLRTQRLLRRLVVTPMRPREFLLGFLLGRGVLVVPEAIAIALFGALVWGVPFRGSLLAFALLVLAGGFAFMGLGCLLAARPRTIEAIAGLTNLCQLPMWLLGGVFFSNERFDGALQWLVEAVPLTHLNGALRDVMLEPAGLIDVAAPLGGLVAFGALCFVLAVRWFRWT
ncbi:MAG: ABC transporter permease [Planctomycetes bacterium]|nr:ABC transporter permease [Planctomycetota bacterium]